MPLTFPERQSKTSLFLARCPDRQTKAFAFPDT